MQENRSFINDLNTHDSLILGIKQYITLKGQMRKYLLYNIISS